MKTNNHYKKFEYESEKKYCIHLQTDKSDIVRYFINEGIKYYFLCLECAEKIPDLSEKLMEMNIEEKPDFYEDLEFSTSYIKGNPEILINIRENIKVIEKEIKFDFIKSNKIIKYVAIKDSTENELLAFMEDLSFFILNLNEIKSNKLFTIKNLVKIDLNEKIMIDISSDRKFIYIVNIKGQFGFVYSFEGDKIMEVDRGDYRFENSIFPIKFIIYNNQTHLIHGSNWNKIDIFNLVTKKCLTERETSYENHYLDYFYGRLKISPNNKWLASNGWYWSPVGAISIEDIKKWINNPYVPEDDHYSIDQRDDWDIDFLWVSENIIASSGYNHHGENTIPGIMLFDAKSKEEVGWFPGPEEKIFYGEYLFSFGEEFGISIWNIETGELIYKNNKIYCDDINTRTKTIFYLNQHIFFKNTIKF